MIPALLFVYGTLRKGGGNPLQDVLGAYARFAGEATWSGSLYKLGAYPGAVASSDPARRVQGELYELADAARAFELLDAYEECGSAGPQPRLFARKLTQVTTAGGCGVEAWIYLYNRPVDGLPEIELGDWLK